MSMLTVHQTACYWQNNPGLSRWYIHNDKPLNVENATTNYHKILGLIANPDWTGNKTIPSLMCTLRNKAEVDNEAGHTMNMDTSADPDLTNWYHTIDNQAGATLNISNTGRGNQYVGTLSNNGVTTFGILLL